MKEDCPDIRTVSERSFEIREERKICEELENLRSVNVSEVFCNRQRSGSYPGYLSPEDLKLRMWPDGVSEKSGTIQTM